MENKKDISAVYTIPVEHIYSRSHEKCLDVKDHNQSEGAELHLWDANLDEGSNDNQLWDFNYHGKGFFSIRSCQNDFALTSVGEGEEWNSVLMHKFTGDLTQLWLLKLCTDGSIGIINAKSQLALDLNEDCGENGTAINSYTWHQGHSERWRPLSAFVYFSILDTSFLRSSKHIQENSNIFAFYLTTSRKEISVSERLQRYPPIYVLLDLIEKEVAGKLDSEEERVKQEIASARYKLSSLAGETLNRINADRFPKAHEKTELGANSRADIAIIDAAIAYAEWPYALVYIETLDTGIMLDASNLFKKGRLIGCDSYLSAFGDAYAKRFEQWEELFKFNLMKSERDCFKFSSYRTNEQNEPSGRFMLEDRVSPNLKGFERKKKRS